MTITLYIPKKDLNSTLYVLKRVVSPLQDLDEMKELYNAIEGISIHRDNVMLANQVAIQVSYEEFEAIGYFIGGFK